MNKLFFTLLGAAFMLNSCVDPYYIGDPIYNSAYKPILMERSELASSIQWTDAKVIETPGKIYIKDNLLFINEKFEGVHVYDNSNPENPIALGFITIPGNIDISIREDIIYADNARDLVAFRVVNDDIQMLDRNMDVFPEMNPPDGLGIPYEYTEGQRPENTVIVKWILK